MPRNPSPCRLLPLYNVTESSTRAKTGMLCFDYNTHKLRLLPEELATQVSPPAGQ